MEKVYLQTYSVRNMMASDFLGAMKRISQIGYSGVEFAGNYGGLDATDLKTLLSDLGLDCICAHVGMDNTQRDLPLLAEVGTRYVVCPIAHIASYDDAMRTAERLNALGDICAAYGVKYGYHNHTQEFAKFKGKYILDHLIENTDPRTVMIELDVGWVTTAGVDAVAYINKHAGRFDLIHAKEAGKVVGVCPPVDRSNMTAELINMLDELQRMNVKQGDGVVDWKAVRAAADAQGAQGYVVEREFDYANDIWQCVTEDLEFMKTV